MSAEGPSDTDPVADQLARARAAAHAGAEVPGDARLRAVKAALVLPMRPVTGVQHECNDALIEAIDALRRDRSLHEQALAALRASAALTDAALDELNAEVRALRAEVEALRDGAGTAPADAAP